MQGLHSVLQKASIKQNQAEMKSNLYLKLTVNNVQFILALNKGVAIILMFPSRL